MGQQSLPMDLLRLHFQGTDLTPMEKQALRLIAIGYTQPEAAKKLNKGLETIRAQLKMARARLGAKTNCHAVAIAVSLDII